MSGSFALAAFAQILAVDVGEITLDPVDDHLTSQGLEDLERVLRVGDLGIDNRLTTGFLEHVDEAACLLDRSQTVLVSVHDEKRRTLRVDLVHR